MKSLYARNITLHYLETSEELNTGKYLISWACAQHILDTTDVTRARDSRLEVLQ